MSKINGALDRIPAAIVTMIEAEPKPTAGMVAGIQQKGTQTRFSKVIQSSGPAAGVAPAAGPFVVVRRGVALTFLTLRGSWTNNPSLAHQFQSPGSARIALRGRPGEVVAEGSLV